jgi:hypothetical protein
MQFPKPPKTQKKSPSPIKRRTAIVRNPPWKPLRRAKPAALTLVPRKPIARSHKPATASLPPSCGRVRPFPPYVAKTAADYIAAEAKRLARKAKRKSDRAIDSNGRWPVRNGVQFIPDPTNPRGQREICLTDAAWARAQAAIRLRSKNTCEKCSTPAPEGDSHHIHGRGAGKRDDHPDALLNLCRPCHNAAKIERKEAA